MASSRMTSSHLHDSDDAEVDEEQEWDRGASRAGTSAKRKKKDEPMSPVAVVCECSVLSRSHVLHDIPHMFQQYCKISVPTGSWIASRV